MINKNQTSMDEIVPPVVTAKPIRGREMISKTVPTDVFESMRLMSAKNAAKDENLNLDLQKPREGAAEVYHEGFVEGKRYLVPDSNLEAMRDIVNFKMRPRRSIRYKHQTSYDVSDYDHFRKKLSHLIDKLETMPEQKDEEEESEGESNESDEEEEKIELLDKETECVELEEEEDGMVDQAVGDSEEEEEESIDELVKVERFISNKALPKMQHEIGTETEPEPESEEESEDKVTHTTVQEVATETEAVSEEESETKPEEKAILIPKQKSAESDKWHVHFLISGHFKRGKKPIYIIQEYNGENLFKDQKTDIFTASEKNGDIDIRISGKFYDENILEESKGKPVALKTKPNKIIIDEKICKVYQEYFEDVIRMNTADVFVRGQFIHSKVTNTVTPFIRFGVKRKFPATQSSTDIDNNLYNNKQPSTIMTYMPKLSDPFSRNTKSKYAINSYFQNPKPTVSNSENRPIKLSSNILSETDEKFTNNKKVRDPEHSLRHEKKRRNRRNSYRKEENPDIQIKKDNQ